MTVNVAGSTVCAVTASASIGTYKWTLKATVDGVASTQAGTIRIGKHATR